MLFLLHEDEGTNVLDRVAIVQAAAGIRGIGFLDPDSQEGSIMPARTSPEALGRNHLDKALTPFRMATDQHARRKGGYGQSATHST